MVDATLVPIQGQNIANLVNYCVGLTDAELVVVLPVSSTTELRLNKNFDPNLLLAPFRQQGTPIIALIFVSQFLSEIAIVGSRLVSVDEVEEVEVIESAGYGVAGEAHGAVLHSLHAGFPPRYVPATGLHVCLAVDLRGIAFRK